MLNDNIRKLHNTCSTELAVVLTIREHAKTIRSFSLNRAIDKWWREFFWPFWLKEDMLNNTELALKHFLLSVTNIPSTGQSVT